MQISMFNCMDSIIFKVGFLELFIVETWIMGNFYIALNKPVGSQTLSN